MDLAQYDAHIHMSYQMTTQPKSSYYVLDAPVVLNISRLQVAINAPRHKLTKQETNSKESIHQAILAFANQT